MMFDRRGQFYCLDFEATVGHLLTRRYAEVSVELITRLCLSCWAWIRRSSIRSAMFAKLDLLSISFAHCSILNHCSKNKTDDGTSNCEKSGKRIECMTKCKSWHEIPNISQHICQARKRHGYQFSSGTQNWLANVDLPGSSSRSVPHCWYLEEPSWWAETEMC